MQLKTEFKIDWLIEKTKEKTTLITFNDKDRKELSNLFVEQYNKKANVKIGFNYGVIYATDVFIPNKLNELFIIIIDVKIINGAAWLWADSIEHAIGIINTHKNINKTGYHIFNIMELISNSSEDKVLEELLFGGDNND